MFERFGRKSVQATSAALLAALGVAGIATAQGSGASTPTTKAPSAVHAAEKPGQESKAPENSATDPDNVQQGDQSGKGDTADKPGDKADGPEKADKADGPEQAGESGSEVPGNDGPGGHADEPGNPMANTQQQGQH